VVPVKHPKRRIFESPPIKVPTEVPSEPTLEPTPPPAQPEPTTVPA
jgi:hypothetical protein